MHLSNKAIYQQFILLALSLLLSISSHALSPQILEELKKDHILDTTQTLTTAEIEKLKQNNEVIFKQKKIDLKILMISSLSGEPIENAARDVFNTIKIGNAQQDNGVLLLIAKNDRKMRIEVGYGLEGDLTDIKSGRIIRDILAPHFKNDEYYTGIALAQNEIGQSPNLAIEVANHQQKAEEQPLAITSTQNTYQYPTQPENPHVIRLDQPSKNFINYFIVFIWNIMVSCILVIYFAPIYQTLKKQQIRIKGIPLFMIVFLPIHHLFCWIVTGLNFFLLFGLYALVLWMVVKFNHYQNIYKWLKLSALPKKIPKKFAILFIGIPIILAFILPNIWIPVLMFFIFCPFILLLIWALIYSIAKPYQRYYPAEYQEWFKETPSTFARSSSYSSSSSSSSSSRSSSSGSGSSSSSGRSSGGSSGGGGASGSW